MKIKIFKKTLFVLISVVLILLTSSCSKDSNMDVNIDVTALTKEIITECNYPEMVKLEGNKVLNYYQNIDLDLIEEVNVNLKADLSAADEISVFKLKNIDDQKMVLDSIDNRIIALKKAVLDYNPSQTERIDNALLKTTGNYIFFAVSDDNEKVEEIINIYLNEK